MSRIRHPENDPLIWIPGKLQAVAPVIPRTGFWTGNNNLGAQVFAEPDTSGRQTVLKMTEWGPPVMWTLSFAINNIGTLADDAVLGVTAQILFGAGGTTELIEMDWAQGAQISIPCNSFEVIASFAYTAGTSLNKVQISAQAARGSRGTGCDPTMTINTSVFATGNNSSTVTIPRFARKLNILKQSGDVYNAANELQVASDTAFTLIGQRMDGDDLLAFPDGLPLQPNMRYARYANASGGNIDIIWQFKLHG